uniref:Halomucin n=2 Tax=Lygus hesperus TaxID=30085 RepID=A0A0A9Y8A7_LYGHE
MTKRNGGDEQVWLLVGDDGSLQTVKKKSRRTEEEEDYDPIFEDEDDDNDGTTHANLDASDSVHNEVYIDQSQLVEEQEQSENEQEGDDTDGGANNKEESTSNNVDDEDPTAIAAVVIKWTDQATFRLLDLLDQVVAKESEVPSKNDRVWIRIAQDMKPFYYTADECYRKFLYLKKTYRKASVRMANNLPYKWRYFNRMCRVMGDADKALPPSPSTNADSEKAIKLEPVPSTSTSAQALIEEDDDEEVGLSKFDQLLKRKKEMLMEVRHQGEVLEKHIEECLASSIRREHRETEMLHLLTELKAQEQKKLDLFKKLLDKL